MDAPGREGSLSAQAQWKQERLLLGTTVAVGREISGAAGPSPADELASERVRVEDVEDEDYGDPLPLLPR